MPILIQPLSIAGFLRSPSMQSEGGDNAEQKADRYTDKEHVASNVRNQWR